MKTERPLSPVKTEPAKPVDREFARRVDAEEVVPQTKCNCDPFEAILDAYARSPERWDGLE